MWHAVLWRSPGDTLVAALRTRTTQVTIARRRLRKDAAIPTKLPALVVSFYLRTRSEVRTNTNLRQIRFSKCVLARAQGMLLACDSPNF